MYHVVCGMLFLFARGAYPVRDRRRKRPVCIMFYDVVTFSVRILSKVSTYHMVVMFSQEVHGNFIVLVYSLRILAC